MAASWMTDYICDDEATLKVEAEDFAAAVVMTECAVCLFEAPATMRPGLRCGYPGGGTVKTRNWVNGQFQLDAFGEAAVVVRYSSPAVIESRWKHRDFRVQSRI